MANSELMDAIEQVFGLSEQDRILRIDDVDEPSLIRQFEQARDTLDEAQEMQLFHLTSTSRAEAIARAGFSTDLCRASALGRGVNLCQRPQDALRFHPGRADDEGRACLVECRVAVGRAHENTSGPEWVEVDGAKFTKPAHMLPRPGYDAMFGGPDNSFWVIPSGQRVLPVRLVHYQRSGH